MRTGNHVFLGNIDQRVAGGMHGGCTCSRAANGLDTKYFCSRYKFCFLEIVMYDEIGSKSLLCIYEDLP